MVCKYCNETMEFDSTEGIGYQECHVWNCACGASCIVHENGEEDEWQRDEN